MKQKIVFVCAVIAAVFQINAQTQHATLGAANLPARYFQLLEAGSQRVKEKMDAEPGATIASLEGGATHGHFPHAVLLPAVLYTKQHPANKHYNDNNFLLLALRIGDFLAAEYDKGHYTSRGDTDWDTYMWLEAHWLLQNKLDAGKLSRDQRLINFIAFSRYSLFKIVSDNCRPYKGQWYLNRSCS